MKKTMAWLLTLILCLGLCACGAAKAPAESELPPFSPDACAGTYTCEDAVIDGVSKGPGDYTLVLSPDGDSRFLAGEEEHALQEIDAGIGLYGVEDRVYLLTDNGDGTVTMSREDGGEIYRFKLSSLLYEREDAPAGDDEEEPVSAGELSAGLYRCVRVEGTEGEAMEQADASGDFLEVREDGSVLLFLSGEAREYAGRDPATGELAPGVVLTANGDGSLELELPGTSATFAP